MLTLDKKNWMMQLSAAITIGQNVMFEQLSEHIAATLNPLLQRAIVKQGGGYVIELGGASVYYDMNFQLYLQTKLQNPHYPPEIAA